MARAETARQLDLVLPAVPADDILRERLADAVEQFNASTNPGERIDLHHEIEHLRRLLVPEGRR